MMNATEYIQSRLPVTEILAQLAEEAAELSQAALKLRRAIDGTNPTPVSVKSCCEKLVEEYADVELCLYHLIISLKWDPDKFFGRMEEIFDEKECRWAMRLMEEQLNGKEKG